MTAMIHEIDIKNYCSFKNASAKLTPFSLVIGPNGTGKSNFLKLIRDSFLVPAGDHRTSVVVTEEVWANNTHLDLASKTTFPTHFDLQSEFQTSRFILESAGIFPMVKAS